MRWIVDPASGWEYSNPVRVLFGAGRLRELPALVDGRVLLVTTRGATHRGLTGRVTDQLGGAHVHDHVRPNPTLAELDRAIAQWRGKPIDAIVALGGGSAIDVGKVLSLALVAPDFALPRLLEADHPWNATEPLPVVAVPTTAGTGSEVTPFATLWDGEVRKKLSVTTPRLHPSHALIDPELALTLPWDGTLATGLDAYSQCFEAICNRNATPLTTTFAERGLSLVPGALRLLRTDPTSARARSDMAEAALMSGLAISHTRTGLAHSISYPVTAHFGVPHGLACALALPAVLAFNVETDDGRLARVAGQAGLDGPAGLVPAILELYDQLGVADALRSHLSDVGSLAALAPEMLTPGRADNNIRSADMEDVLGILAVTERWLTERLPRS
jgi:phosphonate metabolism-associated iron-containing alcohol dehydrogenase